MVLLLLLHQCILKVTKLARHHSKSLHLMRPHARRDCVRALCAGG